MTPGPLSEVHGVCAPIDESAPHPRATYPLDQEPPAITLLAPVHVTEVYDTYWRFAYERQLIYFHRLAGVSPPWTTDPILQEYRFTNAYRACDRVSQFLIRDVLYEGSQDPDEVFFRTILFKLFNRIETWELLATRLGALRYAEWELNAYAQVLGEAMAKGRALYSAAYIIPSPSLLPDERKFRNHLALIQDMMENGVPKRICDARSMREVFDLLLGYPGIGSFIAYQLTIDLAYSEPFARPESEFVVPGPGARDGIRKCFSELGGTTEAEVIALVADCQEAEFARLGLEFPTLWGRPLQLIDCQNLFCEVGKYARVAYPARSGVGHRTRIKQRYRPDPTPLSTPWFPPHWELNAAVDR